MSYRRRVEGDLEGWIERGLVSAESRAAILESLGEHRRLDAATALGIIGGLLAGVAVIALVAANWTDIPRIARFVTILALFLTVAGAGAWASARGRPIASQVLLAVAALVFAAAIGLTGQIFDIAGDPQAALRGAALAAGLLALAGGSAWTGVLALVFLGLGEAAGTRLFDSGAASWPWWAGVGAAAGAALALRWRSQPLAHAAGAVTLGAFAALFEKIADKGLWPLLAMAALALALAAGGRWGREWFAPAAATLYGWWSWVALWCVAAVVHELSEFSGLPEGLQGVPFSMVMLALSAWVVVLGRVDRHGGVTAAGVLGLIASGWWLLTSLGVGLMTSAAVFAGAAMLALAGSLALRRRRRA